MLGANGKSLPVVTMLLGFEKPVPQGLFDYFAPSAVVSCFEGIRYYGWCMEKKSVLNQLRQLVEERDWSQFHSSENLAKSISIEAAELLELFQWDGEVEMERLRDEIADVLTYCYLLADKHGLDPDEIVLHKLEQTKSKYPADKARGSSAKYDRL